MQSVEIQKGHFGVYQRLNKDSKVKLTRKQKQITIDANHISLEIQLRHFDFTCAIKYIRYTEESCRKLKI